MGWRLICTGSDDWTDQELVEFYRVEASLVQANIPIETDRGRSDEGDPWFVLCNANTGEIVVHFARFDGSFVAAGPALNINARMRDFRALIEAQIASHPCRPGGRSRAAQNTIDRIAPTRGDDLHQERVQPEVAVGTATAPSQST
jgi:hypothetical protein